MIKAHSLKLTFSREMVFSAAFIFMAVYSPLLIHWAGGANLGKKLLPMPFFILLAGLTLGWRAGLAVGLLSPIISFALSGMPKMEILPFLAIQLCLFGLMAGVLKDRFNPLISILVAFISGLAGAGISLMLFSEINPAGYILAALKDGWIGMTLAIAILPKTAKLISGFLQNESAL